MSIPAVKGAEIGPAFANAARYGTEVHDDIFLENGEITRHTNRAGGLEGGITTGQPIVVRAALKPISTTLNPLRSVDLVTGEETTTNYERSDFTAVPRACPIGEAVVAWVLAEALVEKLGGDCWPRCDHASSRLSPRRRCARLYTCQRRLLSCR